MAYTLIIGNKNYSSWSMRAWLLLEFLEVPYQEVQIKLYTATSRSEVTALGGATALVPVLKDDDLAIWDTPAIIEYLYEKYPQVWPAAPRDRARARSICGEIHSGMNYLREAMPVNTRGRYRTPELSENTRSDIRRVVEIWDNCLTSSEGPWLFGPYTAADIMFAPVATRFQTYSVELAGQAKTYQERILAHPHVRKWLDAGKQEKESISIFEEPFAGLKLIQED